MIELKSTLFTGKNGEMVAVDNSCFKPLGLEDLSVNANDMTASSTLSIPNENFNPTQGRLRNKPTTLSGIDYQGLLDHI